jgi:biopolymer transport protein TolR
MKVDLPEISKEQAVQNKEQEYLRIQVTEQGTIYINDTKSETANISSRLKEIKQKKAFKKVVLSADYNVKHGEIVSLMGLCKSAGFTKISIAAQPVMPDRDLNH